MTSIPTLRRASATFRNAVAQPSPAEEIRQQLEILDELKRDLAKRQEMLREEAIDLGLARHDMSTREGAPNRAEYIKLHGHDAWERDHKVTNVRKFVWI